MGRKIVYRYEGKLNVVTGEPDVWGFGTLDAIEKHGLKADPRSKFEVDDSEIDADGFYTKKPCSVPNCDGEMTFRHRLRRAGGAGLLENSQAATFAPGWQCDVSDNHVEWI
jgi:hypothetical protein